MDFEITGLSALSQIKFAIQNSARWQIIPQYLAVDDDAFSPDLQNR